jgi:NADPH-dependent curcumin reductase CurA
VRAGNAVLVSAATGAVGGVAFSEHLQRAAGEGVDVFFDNVGGRQLTLALSVL